jgi:hypothetical protein
MTSDFDALDGEFIELLKRDALVRAAPEGARERVAMRLASAGAIGAGGSVAVATHALAATSIGSSAAAGAGAPQALTTAKLGTGVGASAGMTLGGIAKTFVVGLGLGASVGLGLHVASSTGTQATARVARATDRVPKPEHTRVTAPLERGPAQRVATEAAASGVLTTSEAPALEVAKRAKVASERLRPSSETRPSFNPAPELPLAPSTAHGLAEQQRLLEQARMALGAGKANAALALIEQHREEFPSTAFEEERALLSIRALLALGRTGEARVQANIFETHFPHGLLLQSLHSALTAAGSGADSRTESTGAPQTDGVMGTTP